MLVPLKNIDASKEISLQVKGRDADNKMYDAVFRYLRVKKDSVQKISMYTLAPGPAWLVSRT